MKNKSMISYDEKLLKIRILSHLGDEITIKLPIDFVKRLISNNAFDFFNGQDNIVDSKKIINLLLNAFDYKLSGEIANLKRSNGDIIELIIQ